MHRVAAIGEQLGLRPRVAVRVNPDFELKRSGMQMGGGPKAFGVDSERVPGMLCELATLALDPMGFHIYAGSQILNPQCIVEAQSETFALAYRLADSPLRALIVAKAGMGGNVGRGFSPAGGVRPACGFFGRTRGRRRALWVWRAARRPRWPWAR